MPKIWLNITIELMFAGVITFLARVLSRAKNIFTPKNINSITIIIISEGIQKTNQRQYSKRYLERCQRRVDVYVTVISLYKSIHSRISFKVIPLKKKEYLKLRLGPVHDYVMSITKLQ